MIFYSGTWQPRFLCYISYSHHPSISTPHQLNQTPWPWTSLASTSPVVQRHVFASSCPVAFGTQTAPGPGGQTSPFNVNKVDFKHETLMLMLLLMALFHPFLIFSQLLSAPFLGQIVPPKSSKIAGNPNRTKKQAVINHTNPACDTCHEIPSLIKPQSPSTNRHGWKLNSLYLTTPEIILLILESLANLKNSGQTRI